MTDHLDAALALLREKYEQIPDHAQHVGMVFTRQQLAALVRALGED